MAEPSQARVSALNGAGWLAIDQGDYTRAAALVTESAELGHALGDTVGEAIATVYLGRCKMSSLDTAAGAPDVQRAVALVSQTGDGPATTLVMFYSGIVALLSGLPQAACDVFGRCAAMAAELGLTQRPGRARQMLAYSLLDLGELAAARAALAEGVPVSMEIGDRWIVQIGLGRLYRARDQDRAAPAGAPAGRGGRRVPGRERVLHAGADASDRRPLARAGPAQGRAGGRTASRGGPRLSPEEAIRLALGERAGRRRAAGPSGFLADLDPPRDQVAAPAARGLTNRDIAARLYLSVRTVEAHVDHILTKLGFRTRTQLAAWAHEEGLLAEDT